MVKFGKIVDKSTGAGIPYATLEIISQSGVYLGAGVSASANGSFAIDSLLIKPGNFARFSSVGYRSDAFNFDQFTTLEVFPLEKQSQELEAVVVTATKKNELLQKQLIYGGLGLLALLYFMRKK